MPIQGINGSNGNSYKIKKIIPKDDSDLLQALKEILQILKEEMVDVPYHIRQRLHRTRILVTLIGLLVSDDSRGKEGLLLDMMKKYDPENKKLLDAYLNKEQIISEVSGTKYTETIRDVIKIERNKKSLAHEDPMEQHIISAILDLCRTEKVDLRRGLMRAYASEILGFGEKFLQKFGVKLE